MNYFLLAILVVLSYSCINSNSKSKDNSSRSIDERISSEKALTPPMGWNSWNSLDFRATENDIKAVADYMAEYLLKFGWEYVIVDAGWYYPPEISCNDGKTDNIPQNVDDYGRLIPDVTKYPGSANNKGFKELADYIHSKGLKFGIHIMRGIPWNAAELNLPIKESGYKASEIVDRQNTCEWNKSMYGLKDYEGAKAYYSSLIELYSKWGVDFIKADDMIRPLHEHELTALADAIDEIDSGIILSLSPGKAKISDAQILSKNSEMWRVSNDFWDDWKYVIPMFQLLKEWTPYRAYDNWPDADMLPFGKLRKNGGDEWVASLLDTSPDSIVDEYSRLTSDEMYSVMTLWSIAKSPLILGGYLPENDKFTTKLITNKKAIHANQYSMHNKEIYNNNNIIVWRATDSENNEISYLAIFNLANHLHKVKINLEDLGYKENFFNTYDIWSEKKLGISLYTINIDVEGHGVKFLELRRKNS